MRRDHGGHGHAAHGALLVCCEGEARKRGCRKQRPRQARWFHGSPPRKGQHAVICRCAQAGRMDEARHQRLRPAPEMTTIAAPLPTVLARSRRAVGVWLLRDRALDRRDGGDRRADAADRLGPFHHRMGSDHGRDAAAERRADWADAFAKYQHIPQYIRRKPRHDAGGLQGHLLVGMDAPLPGAAAGRGVLRAVRLVRRGPARSQRRDWPRMLLLFALGGLQGFIGWWMVESGLETRVSVSQYRLAIHLGAALMLFVARSCGSRWNICAAPETRARARRQAARFGLRRAGLCADAAGRAGGGAACRADLQHLAAT